MGTDMEISREKTGRVFINEFSLSSINKYDFLSKQTKKAICLFGF